MSSRKVKQKHLLQWAGSKWQLIITVSLMAALVFGTVLFTARASLRLASSVSDVWQGILENRSQQISDILFENNHYLQPDTLYLAKLKPAFFGRTTVSAIAQDGVDEDMAPIIATSISNICTNIKKGISYSSNLRSCYWMLADQSAPCVLVNGTPALKTQLSDADWMASCLQMKENLFIEWRTIPLSYLNTTQVLTVYRKIQSEGFEDGEVINGFWVLNYDLSNMLNAFSSDKYSSENVYLYDTVHQQTIHVGNLSLTEEEAKQFFEAMQKADIENSFTGVIREENEQGFYYYRVQKICDGMAIAVCLQDVQLSHEINSISSIVIYILMICSFAVLAINFYSLMRYRKYYNGLQKIFSAMSAQREETEATDKTEAETEDTLRRILNDAIDLNELKGLVQSKQELKAELDALYGHVQINSHFLLNTLDSIYWASVSHTGADSRESQMIENLCQILKYALDSSDLYASLEEEMKCAQKYIKIQQMRKNVHFSVDWDIDKSLYTARVGKLILQPVIENCIQHGFQGADLPNACIRISAEKTKKNLLILRIENNGRGISPKRIRTINMEMVKQNYLHSRHIGMANINRRLQVQFGAESGLSLYALPDGGLGVCLTMKYSEYEA